MEKIFFCLWLVIPSLFTLIREKKVLLLTIIITTAFLACVSLYHDVEINPDRLNYRVYVESIESGDSAPIEPIYYLIIYFLKFFFNGINLQDAFLISITSIAILQKITLFKKYGYSLGGCLAIYLSYYFMLNEIIQVRIGLAIGFLYLSWFFLINNKIKYYYIFGFVSCFCHVSCLIFLIGPHLAGGNNGRNIFSNRSILIMAFLIVISLIFPSYILVGMSLLFAIFDLDKIGQYVQAFQDGDFINISYIRLLPHLLLLFLFLIKYPFWKDDKLIIFLVRTFGFGIILFLILAPMPILAYRVSDIFLFSGIFLFGNAYKFMTRPSYFVFATFYTFPILFYTVYISGLFIKQ